MRELASLLFILATAPVHADSSSPGLFGNEKGNGGDAVVCRTPTGEITSVEVLDYYEARTEKKIEIDLGSPESPSEDQIRLALTRLLRLDRERSERLSSWAREFTAEANFLSGIELVDIPDSEHIVIPKGCKIEQAAIQRPPRFPGDARYTVSKDLWDQMSRRDRAGLVLHEIVYREAINEGHTNSVPARYLNSLISSQAFDLLSPQAYSETLRSLPFAHWNQAGAMLLLGQAPLEFYPSQRLAAGYAVSASNLQFQDTSLALVGGLSETGRVEFYESGTPRAFVLAEASSFSQIHTPAGARVHLHPNSAFERCTLLSTCRGMTNLEAQSIAVVDPVLDESGSLRSASLQQDVLITVSGQPIRFTGAPGTRRVTHFYAHQKMQSGCLKYWETKFRLQNQEVKFFPAGPDADACEIEFYPSGQVRQGILAQPTRLKQSDGTTVLFSARQRLEFDESEQVVSPNPNPKENL